MSVPDSGSRWLEPFAYFDRGSCSWKMCQASLLEDSGESCTTWPRQGTWDLGFVYELPMSEHLIFGSGSSSSPDSLLPTPSAYESTPTDEFVVEVRENLEDAHKRLYLPGRKWHAQRTLSRIVPALLPTPGANDSTGGEGETRTARQEAGATGGPSLRDIGHLLPTPATRDSKGPHMADREGGLDLSLAVKLLPTPVVTDSFGSQRSTARTEEWESNPGTTLTDAIWETQGRTTDTSGKLLPTPGEPTAPPSDGGRNFSDGQRPPQLTIEDGSTPDSSSGCSDSPTDGSPCPE